MTVFIPKEKEVELSKFKHIYRLTLEKSKGNVFFTLEKFPIIYLNSSFIYFKQNGNMKLIRETIYNTVDNNYGLQCTLERLFDIYCLNMNDYSLREYFVDDILSIEIMKKIISMYNRNIKQYLEKEEIKKEKKKREEDVQNLIKRYNNSKKKHKYRKQFFD